jgi:hypothetical protein
MMYRLIIKGSRPDALQALKQRNIYGAQVLDYCQHHHETYADVPESALNTLVRWFCEPQQFGEHGFKSGTLLYYH